MSDSSDLLRVVALIDQYGIEQDPPCLCCAADIEAARIKIQAEAAVLVNKSSDGNVRVKQGDDSAMDVDEEEVSPGKVASSSSSTLTTSSSSLSSDTTPRIQPSSSEIRCVWPTSIYGTDIPDLVERRLFRIITAKKEHKDRCSRCMISQRRCDWPGERSVLPEVNLDSVKEMRREGGFDEETLELAGGKDWVQDEESGEMVRRSRRGSTFSTTTSQTSSYPTTSNRLDRNVRSALKNTLRGLQVTELALQKSRLSKGKGQSAVNKRLKAVQEEYRKASRAETPLVLSRDEVKEMEIDEKVTTEMEVDGKEVEVEQTIRIQPHALTLKGKKPQSTLMRLPPSNGPDRNEPWRMPLAQFIGSEEEAVEARDHRESTVISLRKNKGKRKATEQDLREESIATSSMSIDDDLDSDAPPLSAKYRKCLGCTLRGVHCEPVQLMRPTAIDDLRGSPLQKDVIGEWCRNCIECGVLCTFSLIPPIYGNWDHLVLPKRIATTNTEDTLRIDDDYPIPPDDDEETLGGDFQIGNLMQIQLFASNKCSGCHLRKVPCDALPVGENSGGGCLRCRECNVSCSFSLGHPEVGVVDVWKTKGNGHGKEAQEEEDEGQEVEIPRKKIKKGTLEQSPPTTAGSSDLSSPPATPGSISESLRSPLPRRSEGLPSPLRQSNASPSFQRRSGREKRPPPPPIKILPSGSERIRSSRAAEAGPERTQSPLGMPIPEERMRSTEPLAKGGRGQATLAPKAIQSDLPSPSFATKPKLKNKRVKDHLDVAPGSGQPKPSSTLQTADPASTEKVKSFFSTVRILLQPTSAVDPETSLASGSKPSPSSSRQEQGGSPSSASPPRGLHSSEDDADVSMDSAERNLHIFRENQCRDCYRTFNTAYDFRRHRDKINKCVRVDRGLSSAISIPRSNEIIVPSGATMFRCPEVGCNNAYADVLQLRAHRKAGACPDSNSGISSNKIFPCPTRRCRQVFQSQQAAEQHQAKGKCVIESNRHKPRPATVTSTALLPVAITVVLNRMDSVIIAMETPSENTTASITLAYRELTNAIQRLQKIYIESEGQQTEALDSAMTAFETFAKGSVSMG